MADLRKCGPPEWRTQIIKIPLFGFLSSPTLPTGKGKEGKRGREERGERERRGEGKHAYITYTTAQPTM